MDQDEGPDKGSPGKTGSKSDRNSRRYCMSLARSNGRRKSGSSSPGNAGSSAGGLAGG
jgi:hypothetical protein